jgi:hypothetical protein
MEQTFGLRMEQRMKLAPQIIQSIEILQLPILALEERLLTEMTENPVLEMEEPEELTAEGEPAQTSESGETSEPTQSTETTEKQTAEEEPPQFVPAALPLRAGADPTPERRQERPREGRHPLAQPQGRVPRVAAERLVPAVAGQGDHDLAPSLLRQVIHRDAGRVGERLAVVADERLERLDASRLDADHRMLGAEEVGDLAGIPGLVETGRLE